MEKYNEEQIKSAYQKLGIKLDDVIYVTSSLAMMGRPPSSVKSSNQLCDMFYSPLVDAIGGNGTVIVPVFSYTFGKGNATEPAIFHPQNTDADIGLFPNFLLKQEGVKRTRDPMLSMAYIGGNISYLTDNLESSTYTENSFLARLAKSKAKFLNIGIGVGWLPLVHYIDWLLESPYRYNKIFNGYIAEGDELIAKSWMYSVRTLIENSLPDTEEIGVRALNKGIWKTAKIGGRDVYCCDCKEYFEFALNEIKKNPWLVAKGPEINPLFAEKQRTGEEKHLIIENDFNPINWLRYFNSLRRDVVSDSMDAALFSIKKYFPLNITRNTTGKVLFGRVVPERWFVKKASIKDSRGRELLNIDNDGQDVYSYSLPISSTVSRGMLLKHIHIYDEVESKITVYNDRDWGFSCNSILVNDFVDEEYFVNIDSYFSLGEMAYGSLTIDRNMPQDILICCYTEGPNRENENLSGVIAGLQLYRSLNERKVKANVRILFLPNFLAFLCWLEKNSDLSRNINSAYHLKFVGTGDELLLQGFRKVNEDVSSFFEHSKPFIPFDEITLPFDNFILSSETLGLYSAHIENHTSGKLSNAGFRKTQKYLLELVG